MQTSSDQNKIHSIALFGIKLLFFDKKATFDRKTCLVNSAVEIYKNVWGEYQNVRGGVLCQKRSSDFSKAF